MRPEMLLDSVMFDAVATTSQVVCPSTPNVERSNPMADDRLLAINCAMMAIAATSSVRARTVPKSNAPSASVRLEAHHLPAATGARRLAS
jgi:hypothetical protein